MPTCVACGAAAFRRRRCVDFARGIGVARADSVVDYAYLEFCTREVLNKSSRCGAWR